MKGTPFWYSILRGLAIIVFKIFFAIRIEGKENIPYQEGAILASNHLSYLDPIVLGILVPRRVNFMAKEELFENFLFRWVIVRLGAFPIKKEGIDGTTYKKILKLLRKREVVVLFPEGTRSIDGTIGQLHTGIARIALKADVPLIPIIVWGTEKVLPRGKKLIRLARIRARAGKPLKKNITSNRKITRKDIEELQNELEKKMRLLHREGLS
jgi:1-acyl-sn-glycerol-3-phosphate acyltransferase